MRKYRDLERSLTSDDIQTWAPKFSPNLVDSAFFASALRHALMDVHDSHPEDTEAHERAVVDATIININEYQ